MSRRQPTPPAIGSPGPWSFPTPQRHVLDNGLTVLAFHRPGQRIVSATVACRLPLSIEPSAVEGVATIVSRVLDEGSLQHQGDSFADVLEAHGAALHNSVSQAGTQVMLDVPASRLPDALPLLGEAVITPQLLRDNVQRHVALRLADIEQAAANSSQTASRVFAETLFQPSCRLSRPSGGTDQTVAQIDPEVVGQFHATHYRPDRAALIVGGDFTAGTDIVGLAEAAFGHWQPPAAEQAIQTPDAEFQPPQMLVVHRPGAVQADLRLGGPGIDRTDERWADAIIAGYAMGGAFMSRLNRVLREERGFTYGVGFNFSPQLRGGSFAVAGSFRTEVLADAVVEAHRLLRIDQAPFTVDEVRRGVDYHTGVAPLRYATADAVVDQAALQYLADLPDDYLDQNLRKFARVSPESATTAYQSLVDADALTMVVVGDADVLSPALVDAGFPVSTRRE